MLKPRMNLNDWQGVQTAGDDSAMQWNTEQVELVISEAATLIMPW